jgi:O-methyltransferase involved in polyketide biosynthesis
MAIEVVDRLAYNFADSNRGARLHAVRVATFDAAVHLFLGSHPAGTVVGLGEGLETIRANAPPSVRSPVSRSFAISLRRSHPV